MTTNELAKALGLSPESLRQAHSKAGNYYGLVPLKLPNGRLAWPDDSIAQLKTGGTKC